MKYFGQVRLQWMTSFRKSVSGHILTATITVAAVVCLVKGATLVKEMLVARRFGASDSLDAFYVALILPVFLTNVVSDSFTAAFIPTYIEVTQREGKPAAQRLFSSVAVFNLAVLVVTSLLLTILHWWLLPLLGSGFAPNKLALTRTLSFILLGYLCLSGLSALWRAALNAHEQFALTAIAPIMNPSLILLALLVAGSILGIYALALGTVAGLLGELAVSGYNLRRSGISLFPRWYGLDASMRSVLRQYAPLIAGSLLMCSTALVDQAMAAMLGAGSVSALNYANKVLAIPLNLAVYSFSITVFPSFSRLSASGDWQGMRRVLSTYTRLMLVATVPLTLVLFFFSEPLVGLLFHGGAFTRKDVHLVAQVQALLCLQLPFYSTSILYVRAISSLKRNQILMWGTTISVSANALLNLLFMKFLGLPGIALSTSVVFAMAWCYLWFMLWRTLEQLEVTTRLSSDAIAPSDSLRLNLAAARRSKSGDCLIAPPSVAK